MFWKVLLGIVALVAYLVFGAIVADWSNEGADIILWPIVLWYECKLRLNDLKEGKIKNGRDY